MFIPGHRLTPHCGGPRLAPLAPEAEMGESFMTRGSLGEEASPIACDLSALSPDQRARLREVRSQLRPMVRRVRDLPDGYAFLLSAPEGSLVFRIVSQVNIGHGYSPGGEPWRIAFVRSWSAKPIGTILSACTERHRPPRDSAAAPGPCC